MHFVEGSQARLLPLRRLCIVVHSSAFACALYENVITEVKIFTPFSPASVAKAVPSGGSILLNGAIMCILVTKKEKKTKTLRGI